MENTRTCIAVRWEPCPAFTSDGDAVCAECGWLDHEHEVAHDGAQELVRA